MFIIYMNHLNKCQITDQEETHDKEMLYQYFIVYFHIQKDKIEIILSSIFFL